MFVSIMTVIMNAAFVAVLNMDLYTDRAMMPDGQVREWHRSPISRLYIADQPVLLYLQLALAAVSVITSVLIIFGVKSSTVKTVRMVSTIASAVMFVIIMIVTSNIHATYA